MASLEWQKNSEEQQKHMNQKQTTQMTAAILTKDVIKCRRLCETLFKTSEIEIQDRSMWVLHQSIKRTIPWGEFTQTKAVLKWVKETGMNYGKLNLHSEVQKQE